LISDDSGPSSATCKLAAWSSTGPRPGRPLLGSADQWDFSAVKQWEYRPDGRAGRPHWSTAGRSTARQRRPVGPPARRPVGVPAGRGGRAGPLVDGGEVHCSAVWDGREAGEVGRARGGWPGRFYVHRRPRENLLGIMWDLQSTQKKTQKKVPSCIEPDGLTQRALWSGMPGISLQGLVWAGWDT